MQVHSPIIISLQRPLAVFANGWRHLNRRTWTTYRPEKHYMRGPGPKCREKQARLSIASSTPAHEISPLVLSLKLGQAN
jgi:hypothetical protein